MRRIAAIAFVFALSLGAGARAAAPDPPTTITYQGVLLDNLGDPRTGPIDLTIRIYDAATLGVLVYKEEFLSVALADGVFVVDIGPSGAATDTPTNPLTTDLEAAFTADFASTGPDRFVELTVGAEMALGRIQVLSAPFAIRSRSADVADTATTATTAQSASAVNGLDASFVTELFEHGDADGTGEDNDGPTEGLDDTDLDGLANFIDPDNDDDTILDGDEISQGTHPNLVTPILSGIDPTSSPSHKPTSVTVSGLNFDPGVTVQFGTQNPPPQNVTLTSFDVTVGPQAVGPAPVDVQNPNGETDATTHTFFLQQPDVTGFVPSSAFFLFTSTVTVNGTSFEPGLTVQFGSENPVPQNVTETSFDVVVGPQAAGLAPVTVTLTNGEQDTETFDFSPCVPEAVQLGATQHATLSVLGDLQTLLSSGVHYGVDTVGNGSPDVFFPFVGPFGGTTPSSQPAVVWDPAGEVAGIRCRGIAAGCSVEVYRDADGDRELELGEEVVVETIIGVEPRTHSPDLAFDANDRVVAGYLGVANLIEIEATVIRDLDGDGQFGGVGERVTIESNPTIAPGTNNAGGVALDPADRVAYVYAVGVPGQGPSLRVAYDRDGDGDFDDSPSGNPELFTAAALNAPATCADVAFDPSGRLAVVYGSAADSITVLRDLDSNGDFGGASEVIQLENGTPGQGCGIAGSATGNLAVGFTQTGPLSLVLAVDRDDDGTFGGAGELVTLQPGGVAETNRVAVALNASGTALVARGQVGTGRICVDSGP